MAWVEKRITRTTQPQDGCGIDWNNPLSQGLISAVSPFGDAVTNKAFQRQGTPVIAANATGRAVVGNGSSYIKSTIAPAVFTKPEVTLFYVGSVAYVTSSVVASVTGSGGNQLLTFIFDASNQQNVVYRAANGGGSLARLYDVFNPVGSFKWGATYDGTSNLKIYNNGAAVTTNGTVGTLNNATPTGFDSVCLGGADRSSDLFQASGGEANVAYAWNRALSAAEHKSLSDNPWQLYEPEVQRIWVDDYVFAGGAATVIPIGVQATGSVGTPSATGAATVTPAGVQASSAVGTPVAVGGSSIAATVLPAGVQATAAIGTVSAIGAALAQPAGVTATGAVGTPVAIAGTNIPATVTPAGVQAASAVGTPTVTAAAIAQPLGVAATTYVGTPTIATGVSGVAVAYPAGVQAIGQVGTLIATGAAWTAAVGVQAVASVGTPTAYAGVLVSTTAGAQTRPSRLQDGVRFERMNGSRPGRIQTGSRASR